LSIEEKYTIIRLMDGDLTLTELENLSMSEVDTLVTLKIRDNEKELAKVKELNPN